MEQNSTRRLGKSRRTVTALNCWSKLLYPEFAELWSLTSYSTAPAQLAVVVVGGEQVFHVLMLLLGWL